MEGLQIVNLENNDITTWNFEQIKEKLSEELSVYKNMVYTDESIKSAKEDKKLLADAKKLVEERRKEYKKKCLEPYEALEFQIKEITSMIEEHRGMIDNVIKEYTERQKQEKKAEVRKYYDKKSFVLGDLADKLFEKLLDSKWLNASTSKAKYEEGVQIAINKAVNDINEIKDMNSPFIQSLLEEYVVSLSVEQVKSKNEELAAAHDKAGFSEQQQPSVQQVEATQKAIKTVANTEGGTTLKIHASQYQLNQILDFMKAIGVTYEIEQVM